MWIIWMEYEWNMNGIWTGYRKPTPCCVWTWLICRFPKLQHREMMLLYGLYKYPWSILDSDRAWCNVLGGSPGLLNRLGSGWSYNYSRSQNILGSWCAGSYWRLFMSQSMVDSWKKYRVDQIWHPIWSHEFLPAHLWVLSLRLVERFPRKLQQIVQYFAQDTVLMAMNALASKSHLKRWCFQRESISCWNQS